MIDPTQHPGRLCYNREFKTSQYTVVSYYTQIYPIPKNDLGQQRASIQYVIRAVTFVCDPDIMVCVKRSV